MYELHKNRTFMETVPNKRCYNSLKVGNRITTLSNFWLLIFILYSNHRWIHWSWYGPQSSHTGGVLFVYCGQYKDNDTEKENGQTYCDQLCLNSKEFIICRFRGRKTTPESTYCFYYLQAFCLTNHLALSLPLYRFKNAVRSFCTKIREECEASE